MRTKAFIKRNLLEMARDPLSYIFSMAFPVVMLVLFTVISSFAGESGVAVFKSQSLIPGIIMFGFSFEMLLGALLVSKDKKTSFLKRLYVSPMKNHEFIIGYSLPIMLIGVIQAIVCVLVGFICAIIVGESYFSFLSCVLLIIEMLPMLIFNVALGIFFGSILSDKSAPAITSVFISGCGILGGAWMPLDIMGGFETFCRFLPFYPSVYIGRVITGAEHSIIDYTNPIAEKYVFDSTAALGIIPICVFVALSVILSLIFFAKMKRSDN